LLLAGGPWNSRWAGPEGGEKGVAHGLGTNFETGIYQARKSNRSAAGGLDRVFISSEFAGPVEAGKAYLLLDDTLTQGGTFAALTDHITRNGGSVTGIIALTGKEYSRTLSLSDGTLAKVRAPLGDLESDFREATGHGFDSLTESEARTLATWKPLESVRSRILVERDAARRGNPPPAAGVREVDGPTFSIAAVAITRAPYRESGSDLRRKLMEDTGPVVGNAYTGWDIGLSQQGAKHVVAQNKGVSRRVLPHFKELLESAVWLGRRPHRDAAKERGIRWQHLFYTPFTGEEGAGVVRFVVNETWQGERVIDAKALSANEVPVEFRAAVRPEADSSISPTGKTSVRRFAETVKAIWPDDGASLRQPVNDRRTFSTVRASSPLLAAIEALGNSPESIAKVFTRMRQKVGEVRDRMDQTRRTAGFSEEELDPDRFEKLRDLATLEAIAKALPAPIRGKFIGGFRDLEELKTSKGREKYLVNLLPKVEQALESHLVDQFRAAIRREMVRASGVSP
jgi:hypothetical protein